MAADPDRRTQLLRGALDTCLLALLAHTPTHAYDLVVQLERHGLAAVSYGTVYPLITRLRRQGLLHEHPEPSPHGPARKVYALTTHGHAALAAWAGQWQQTTATVSALLATTGALPTPAPPAGTATRATQSPAEGTAEGTARSTGSTATSTVASTTTPTRRPTSTPTSMPPEATHEHA